MSVVVPVVEFFRVTIAPIIVSLVSESITFPVILIPSAKAETSGIAGVEIVEAVRKPDNRKNDEKINAYILFIRAAANN